MADWHISSGSIESDVDAELKPVFVIKHGGKTYVTVLVQELTGSATQDPRKFYENRYQTAHTADSTGTVAKIDASGENEHSGVNVTNVHRR